VNAYVTIGKTVKVRPGTFRNADVTTSPVNVGLTAYGGVQHVFCHQPVTVPTGYVCNVLVNPTLPTDPIKKIHFAAPYMGFLYVVAEFNNGTVAHYWLQTNGVWTPNTVHFNGDFVSATVDNGFAFQAVRLEKPHTVWAAESVVAVNDIFEPTVYNGFMFKAIAVTGSAPHTGSSEPLWPAAENAQLQEFGDFGTTSAASSSPASLTQAPSQSITDRYGNSATFNGTTGEVTTVSTLAAQTTVTVWAAGQLYQPGAVVQPSTGQGAFINAIPNGDFEAGDDGNWILPSGSNLFIVVDAVNAYQGSHVLKCTPNHQTSRAVMNTFGTVTSGQSVTATAYVNPNNSGSNLTVNLNLNWYNSSDTFLSRATGPNQQGVGYRQTTVTGNAPAGATRCRVEVEFSTGTVPSFAYADIVSWNLETPVTVSPFLFEAVQAASGTSGSTEPTWPVVAGGTVVDGGVTWQAIGTSIITWQALPLMKSGAVEPTWPTTVGLAVADGNMSWVCADRRITDVKCPNTTVVIIAASKVFCGDKDIIAFCATTNCLDWTSANDAGYIPFGLNSYGSEPVAMLGLYRSNLVAFNGLGYQMWQVDQDPANMAFLDGSPIGSIFSKSGQPVNTDFVFLTPVGYRSIGIAGANSNLQAGSFGKNVDPLVKASIKALSAGDEPRSLFYPGTGQYWGIFGNQVYVLTMNGATVADQSWSRYLFPSSIDYYTISDGVLFLRSGNLVWQLSEDALYDDIVDVNTHAAFTGNITWPFLDFGTLGLDKDFEGIDLVCTGSVTVNIGYDQTNFALITPDYVIAGDTLPGGGMVPFPMTAPSFQISLTFAAGQAWEWEALNAYVTAVPHT
jgi:hypothetical protein